MVYYDVHKSQKLAPAVSHVNALYIHPICLGYSLIYSHAAYSQDIRLVSASRFTTTIFTHFSVMCEIYLLISSVKP